MQGFVGEILVFDLMETCLAETINICLKTLASDELILATYLLGETIGVTNIVKDREKYDK